MRGVSSSRMCSVASAALFALWSCGGAEPPVLEQDPGSQVGKADTVTIGPDDLRGYLEVIAPTPTLPDFAPYDPPSYGPGDALVFDNDSYHLYSGGTKAASHRMDQTLFIPQAKYTLVVNDTWQYVTVERQQTVTVKLGRIEVEDVAGEYAIRGDNDFSGYSWEGVLDANISTGTGINVTPGSYTVTVSYQKQQRSFQVTVGAGKTVVVRPDELRGSITLLPPADKTLPDWSPVDVPTYGPGDSLAYDNEVYHVYAGDTRLATLDLGTSYSGPEGKYTVVVNDTRLQLTITRKKTTVVHVGRIEVNDVAGSPGTFSIQGDNDFWGYSWEGVLDEDDIPMGTGVNVLPGEYKVTAVYQGTQKSFAVTIENN